jgi:hypothetical protein
MGNSSHVGWYGEGKPLNEVHGSGASVCDHRVQEVIDGLLYVRTHTLNVFVGEE